LIVLTSRLLYGCLLYTYIEDCADQAGIDRNLRRMFENQLLYFPKLCVSRSVLITVSACFFISTSELETRARPYDASAAAYV